MCVFIPPKWNPRCGRNIGSCAVTHYIAIRPKDTTISSLGGRYLSRPTRNMPFSDRSTRFKVRLALSLRISRIFQAYRGTVLRGVRLLFVMKYILRNLDIKKLEVQTFPKKSSVGFCLIRARQQKFQIPSIFAQGSYLRTSLLGKYSLPQKLTRCSWTPGQS